MIDVTNDALLARLDSFERRHDFQGALMFLAQRNLSVDSLLNLLISLYRNMADGVAFVVADRLHCDGLDTWVVNLIREHLAYRLGREETPDKLAAIWRSLPQSARKNAVPMMNYRLRNEALSHPKGNAFDRTVRVLEVAFPPFAGMFSLPLRKEVPSAPPAPDPTPPLLAFAGMPPGSRPARHLTTAFNGLYFPHLGLQSRPLDIGPRMAAAAASYGWTTSCFDFENLGDTGTLPADFRRLADHCEQAKTDVLVMDQAQNKVVRAENLVAFLREVRRRRPGIRIVVFPLDAWLPEVAKMAAATAREVDAFWSATPTNPLWREPEFAGKVLHFPCPCGPVPAESGQFRIGDPSFSGAILPYNWFRALWLEGLIVAGETVHRAVTRHEADQLPAMESYQVYMTRLARSGCCLNFTQRYDGSRVLVGRTFEIPLAGSLMVHEVAEDMDHYFTAGTHYLRFATLAELVNLLESIRRWPDWAAEVRRTGHAYAREAFGQEKIVGYLERALF